MASADALGARAAGVPSTYAPLSSSRVLDTRDGTGVPGGATVPLGPASQVTLDLSSKVPADATAVVLNVTGAALTAYTFVTVFPANVTRPGVTSLNLAPGQTRPNSATVALSPDRKVNVYNETGNTHIIADLAGYYTSGNASRFIAVTPGRVLDTRGTGRVGPGGETTIDLSWLDPSSTAVTFNLTGLNATTSTFVTAYPDGTARPLASNLNLGPNEVTPNLVTVQLGSNRKVKLFNDSGSVDLIADLAGVYDTNRGDKFVPVTPVRAMDTRETPPGLQQGRISALGWPAPGPKGYVANLTGTNSTTEQYVVSWPPPSQTPPVTSNLNITPGQTVGNNFIGVVVDNPNDTPDFGPCTYFTTSAGTVDIIVDVAGFFV
ncbi:hypothetical protein [Actinocrispum wychmicini]|uniref:hypothetical protein n=1 Tax=Actinocrispum wychmicini TaxID=1213861 RepID=UPI0010538C07|nr:hypothetical protein [Actinocrispum wychmicini]